jgi:hypothetical protein
MSGWQVFCALNGGSPIFAQLDAARSSARRRLIADMRA